MDFELSFEQITFVEAQNGFMAKTCTKAYIDRIESTDEYPDALWDGLVELGVFGLGIPEELGGVGGGMLEIALACEVFGYYGGPAGMTYMPPRCFASQTLLGGADPGMQQRVLPPVSAR